MLGEHLSNPSPRHSKGLHKISTISVVQQIVPLAMVAVVKAQGQSLLRECSRGYDALYEITSGILLSKNCS